MLQSIPNGHDPHHIETRRNSIGSLTASLSDGKIHLLLGCSGSVATIKLPNIIQALSKYPSSRLSIRVVLTHSASQFLAGQSKEQPTVSAISSLPNVDAQYVDADEWRVPWVRGSGILHIELRRWADVFVIAPLSANTMAKIVGGFSDSLLTSVVRAWDPWRELDAPNTTASTSTTSDTGCATATDTATQEKPGATDSRRLQKRNLIVAPAMNTAMWRNPITAKHISVLEGWGVQSSSSSSSASTAKTGDQAAAAEAQDPDPSSSAASSQGGGGGWFEVLRPQSKVLACGDAGDGAMIEWTNIVKVIEKRVGLAA
ncbi:putative flavoprotein [Nemania sp. FL0916]|nr:putative flavoprotein [Nemania sp. FL0916]